MVCSSSKLCSSSSIICHKPANLVSRRLTRLEDVNIRPATVGLLTQPPSPSLYTYKRGDIKVNDLDSGMTLRNRSKSTVSAKWIVNMNSFQERFNRYSAFIYSKWFYFKIWTISILSLIALLIIISFIRCILNLFYFQNFFFFQRFFFYFKWNKTNEILKTTNKRN